VWRCRENALWDIVGKVCKQPLHKLWGSFRSEMPLYLTTVWPVDHYQDEVTPAQQAADLLELKERGGYNAFKFRIQRSDWRKDVEAVRLCKEALGPESKIMLDRTGDDAGDWSHETALEVAHALKEVGAVRKTAFLSHLYIKTIILPRQAQDKHRENSKQMPFFAGMAGRTVRDAQSCTDTSTTHCPDIKMGSHTCPN
jgi:hypothetical protein